MQLLASGVIAGPEAHGSVSITIDRDGRRVVKLTDLWVAPGAPDVRLLVSADPMGATTADAVDVGPLPYGRSEHILELPSDLPLSQARSVVIYCSVYSVYFGHAELRLADQ